MKGLIMKPLRSAIAILGLAAWATGVANGNVLFNANLDQIGLTTQNNPCPIGWIVDAELSLSGSFLDGGDSETFCNVCDSGGDGFFFKPFQGTVGPPADLLSVQLYQDNPCTPNTVCTFSGYASCEANYSGLYTTNSPAPQTLFFVEFLDASGNGLVTNVYDLIANGLPTTGAGSMALLTTPPYTAPAKTATVRVGAWMRNTYTTTGAQSFFVDCVDLETTAAPGSPVITTQPAQTTATPGATVTLSVAATGATAYQWQLYGTNISDVPGHISGSTSQTLNITGVSGNDVGHYRVLVSNASGGVYSADAPLALDTLSFFPVIALDGKKGDTYRVDYSTEVAPTTWIPLTTNKLITAPQYIIDTTSPMNNTRFYREVFLY
jgi:Immunoglobulin domain